LHFKSYPLTRAISPGARGPSFILFKPEFDSGKGPIFMLFKPEFGAMFQVGVPRINHSVSPLSLRERVRVRGFSGHAFDVNFRARKSVVIYRLRH
jgi:hypothetical protein